jgi:hypothetical protein
MDKQHIQRKRHIGNGKCVQVYHYADMCDCVNHLTSSFLCCLLDIVCIVFVDGRQPFNPAAIKSQFLHVFIVVHEEKAGDEVHWR